MAESSEGEFTARRQVIARALDSVLADGEEYVVRHHDGEVEVLSSESTELRQKHPRLYGHLLALHEQVNDSGNLLTMGLLLATAIFCLGVHLEWWDEWLGAAAMDKLRSAWFYGVAMVAAFLAGGTLAGMMEKRTYRRARGELYDVMKEEGLNRDLLLAMIEGDPALAKAGEQIKLDRDSGGRGRE